MSGGDEGEDEIRVVRGMRRKRMEKKKERNEVIEGKKKMMKWR